MQRPTLREWTIKSAAGEMTFLGQLLGRATTESDRHRNHPDNTFAERGVRCSACRWFSIELYIVEETKRYLIYTRGDTRVPGEDPIPRVTFASDARGVLDMLIQRQPVDRPDPHNRDTWTWSPPRLSRSALICLEQAGIYDPDLQVVIADWNSRGSLRRENAA